MALRDVRHVITDYGIGASSVKGEGVHIKIGASNIISDIPLTITSTMTNEKVREKLGNTPLADSCIDSLSAGCDIIYALPVVPETSGSVTAVKGTLTGTGTIEASGEPNNSYTVNVRITEGGSINTGSFKCTVNGVAGDEITIPEDGVYEIEDTGVKITFSEGTFVADESVYFTTTQPKMSNLGILKAIDNIKNLNLSFEFIHIVGATSKALWASLAIQADKFFDVYYKPLIFVCETRDINLGETLDEYMQYLREERKGVYTRDLQVVSGRCTFMRDGFEVDINAAPLIMGLHSRASVQQSIGETAEFDINGALELRPAGIEDYISEIDDLGYTTLRQYIGIEGIYVNNSRTFAKTGSDYGYTERVRAMYKAVRETRKTALQKMQSQIDLSNLEASLKALVEFINIPVEKMVDDGELSSARVIIPEDQDVLSEEKVYYKIRAVPVGILRELEIDCGFENATS